MKKKLICTLLVFALVLCAVPIAFPGLSNTLVAAAYDCVNENGGLPVVEPAAEEPDEILPGWFIRYFVWVERDRDENGVKDDKIVMELIPVDEEQEEEYLQKLKDFSGWDVEEAYLYSPAGGFFTNQVHARLQDFEVEHFNGGNSTVEVGLIDAKYNTPEGAVYYEHKAFAEHDVNYGLVLRVGELKVQVSEDYTKADFTFAAKPDGSGGWEIVLKDAEGNNIDYTLI